MKENRKRILAICGSTRLNSSNQAILNSIASLYEDKTELTMYDVLSEFPHFNPDYDHDDPPSIVKSLRESIEDADGVLICTPEYVFSLPGSLKNALEWTVSTTVFSEKPVALIVASGLGEKAYESLILIMKTLGARFNDNATLLITGARSKLNVDQRVSDPQTLEEIDRLMGSFLQSMDESLAGK